MTGNSTTSPDPSSPGNAITGGYNGGSFAVEAFIVFFTGLAMYNALELVVLIFFTFSKFSGLYFYSLLVSSICVIPYALGFLFKFMMITSGTARWLAVTLITIGWYGMVTGQSVVLWSRLHLLLQGDRGVWTLRWTKWMICIDAVILHIPTTVLTYGSNGDLSTETFVRGYNVMEKIQMCGFFIQEVILSTIYIRAAAKLLRDSMHGDAKKFFWQLLGTNVIIIIMDLGMLSVEAASLYLYETIIKGAIYSIKLKLEFAILGKLIHFVGGPTGTSVDHANEQRWKQATIAYMNSHEEGKSPSAKPAIGGNALSTGIADISDFVDLSKMRSQMSHTSDNSGLSRGATAGVGNDVGGRQRKRASTIKHGRGVSKVDIELARFEHGVDANLPEDKSDDMDTVTIHNKTGEGEGEGEV